MGKINRFKTKVVVTMGVEEILQDRMVFQENVTFTLSELVRQIAQVKAAEKQVQLPSGVSRTSFDAKAGTFVVEFAERLEDFE